MRISFMTMNRILEERAQTDPQLAKELASRQRPLLSQARILTDEELVGRLRVIGVEMDRQRLERWTDQCASAQDLALAIEHHIDVAGACQQALA